MKSLHSNRIYFKEMSDTSDTVRVKIMLKCFTVHPNTHARVRVATGVYLPLTHDSGLFHTRKRENSGVEYL